MPYHWTEHQDDTRLRLWPHQSMTPQGFSWFIGVTALMLTLPLLAVLGSPILWVLMVFFLAAIWGVWRAITSNQAARSMHEELSLSPFEIRLEHVPPKGTPLTWVAHPQWVSVHLHRTGPVEDYLTLRGGGREVELGAFLTPEERAMLYDELNSHLHRL
ncbi:MAG: DUF2244 domain-containing protein [Silicimonas sp.]|nr:DUF2244 domain-containing protein [Silicimonas sp.]